MKINDRTLIIVLFIVLTVLSGAVLVGNREASAAAKKAVVSANQARDAAQLVATNLANNPTGCP